MSNCHQMAIIRLLGSSLQIQSVFLDFFEQKPNRKHKSDNHIQFYSYFFVVIYCYYYIFNYLIINNRFFFLFYNNNVLYLWIFVLPLIMLYLP